MLLHLGVALVMAVGLVGTVIPGLPGLVLILAAGVVYGLVDGFGALGIAVLAVMGVLTVAGELASYVLPHRAGVVAGMPRTSLRLGIAGAVVGFFVLPVLGLPVGAVLGVLVGEQRRLGDWGRAWEGTRRVALGFGVGALAEIGCGILMILSWLIWALFG